MLFARKPFKSLLPLFLLLAFSSAIGQESMLCMGGHWTEDEANMKMKNFRASWKDLESWENRADVIRQRIID